MDILDKIIEYFGRVPVILWGMVVGAILNGIVISFIVLMDGILEQLMCFSILLVIDITGVVAIIKYLVRGKP